MNRTPIYAIVILHVAAALAVAQSNFRDWFDPNIGSMSLRADYNVRGSFNEDVSEQRRKMQITRHDFNLSLPIAQSEDDEWTLNARLRSLILDTDAILPDTFESLPGEWWDVRVGATYRRRLDNDWIAGANITLGSASDQLFSSPDEVVVNASFFLRMPAENDDAWVLLLNYANGRQFADHIPLPGFAYLFDRGPNLRGSIGLPFSNIYFKPTDNLTLEASYLIPRIVHAQVGVDIADGLQFYTAFDWTNDRYFRAARDDDDDRLFYFEKRAVAGFKWNISDNIALDIAGGYAFDRFFFEGENYDDRGDNRISISDGPVLMFQVAGTL